MSTIINTRSPYFIKITPTGTPYTLLRITIELYIYNGVKTTDKPAQPQYTIEKNQFVFGALYGAFEVSELIRDYLYTEYYTDSVDAIWVEADIEIEINTPSGTETQTQNYDYLAIDGYGYFEEGALPRTSTDPTQSSYTPQLLMDNDCVYFVKGRDIRIPIFSEPESIISFSTTGMDAYWEAVENYWDTWDATWGFIIDNIEIVDSDDSEDKIQYVVISQTDDLVDGDTITITSTTGNSQSNVLTLKEICEPRYEKYRVIFYNKYGALQSLWMTKKSSITTNTTDESYKANIMDFTSTPSYSTTNHSKKRFNVLANQSITLNSNFVVEDMNEIFEQMLMSEQIWLESETDTLPVIVKTKSLTRKTSVNDKLINYTIEFDYAFDKINNIR